jgi:hypothetical protein
MLLIREGGIFSLPIFILEIKGEKDGRKICSGAKSS